MPFRAVRIDKTEQGQAVGFVTMTDAELMDGDTLVDVSHSAVNYKDGLALSGKSPIPRRFPMVAGIDFAGAVAETTHPGLKKGDRVVLNGHGASETHFGGYARRARVPGAWLVPLPAAFTPAQAMAIGTAGYTAALCVLALGRHGAKPSDGPVLVTGAAGGVGSVAVALLKKAGWHVVASTGRPAEAAYLKDLGADEILDRAELSDPAKPLGKEIYAAAVDSVGSHTLANALSRLKRGGVAACCGMAQGGDLPASVMPFILRGVTLAGVESVMQPMPARRTAWDLLARDLDGAKLAEMTTTIPFDKVFEAGAAILAGKIRGRTVVEIG